MRAGSWGVVRRLRSAVSYRLKPVLHRRVEDVPVEDRRPRLSFVAERERTGEAPILHGMWIYFIRVSAAVSYRLKPVLHLRAEDVPVEDRRPRLSFVAERERTGAAPILHGMRIYFIRVSAAISYRLKPVLHWRAEDVPVEDRRPRLSFVAERERTGEAPILHGMCVYVVRASAGMSRPQKRPTRSRSSATWNGFSRITAGLRSGSVGSILYAEITITGDRKSTRLN